MIKNLEQLTDTRSAAEALDENNQELTDAIGEVAKAGDSESRAAAQKRVETLEDERARITSHIRDKGWDRH